MEKQLAYTTFGPEIRDALLDVRSLVQEIRRDETIPADTRTAIIKRGLESRIVNITKLKTAILNDMRINDHMLGNLGDDLAGKYIEGFYARTYEITATCPVCSIGEDQNNCSEFRQEVKSEYYISELDLRRGDVLGMLTTNGFEPNCPKCDAHLEITSATNSIYSADAEIISAVKMRVKSAGRYCHKLVDLIFYDESDPVWKNRSITDKYAFSFLLDYNEDVDEPAFVDRLEEQLGFKIPQSGNDDDFRRFFRYRLGMELPRMCGLDDLACYAMLKKLKIDFPDCIGWVQDNLGEPKERKGPSGEIELYKMLQFDFNIYGKKFECQIKTNEMHQKELDRNSAVCHMTYRMVEKYLRQNTYMEKPEAGEVFDFLFRLFHTDILESD